MRSVVSELSVFQQIYVCFLKMYSVVKGEKNADEIVAIWQPYSKSLHTVSQTDEESAKSQCFTF